MKRIGVILSTLLAGLMSVVEAYASTPLFPTDIAQGANGELVMTQKGRKSLDVYSADGATLIKRIEMPATPTGVAVSGDVAYVTTFESKGTLEFVSLGKGAIEGSVVVGSGACAPQLTDDGKTIYICNQFSNSISKVDVASRAVTGTTNVLREPRSAVVSKDGKRLFVANFLTAQAANVDNVAACVSVIDLDSFTKIRDVRLSNGSNALRGITQTPDGKYIYVSHNLGRFTVPTSQLLQGWMNTSAFSVIDAQSMEFVGSIIVDDPERGAAGIWDIKCDEQKIYISHSGTHEVSIIQHAEMLKKLEAYPNKANLDYDLRFLYGLRERIALQGNGPRNMILRGAELVVPTYFADMLNFVDTDAKANKVKALNMNPERQESAEEMGEKYFNDATFCFQSWQSCNGCHPGDGRADGLNWDLMNDGVGNSKNCKSMLFSHVTPPSMISGIRASAELAVRKGFTHIQFFNVSEEYASAVDEYLKALKPVPSPYLVDGELSALAVEGRKVFNKLKCNDCHSGAYYTDMKMYVIGEVEFEAGWDTPTLREVWRTAPYLWDGRAATMREVFEVHKHGIKSKISKKDLDALTEYVLSL